MSEDQGELLGLQMGGSAASISSNCLEISGSQCRGTLLGRDLWGAALSVFMRCGSSIRHLPARLGWRANTRLKSLVSFPSVSFSSGVSLVHIIVSIPALISMDLLSGEALNR